MKSLFFLFLFMGLLFFLFLFMVSCGKGYEFVKPPIFEISPNGTEILINWKHAKGTDIAGYYIYWGMIGATKNMIAPPANFDINGFDHMIDAGYRTSYRFRVNKDITYQFYMKSYDSRGNVSFASDVVYWPRKPAKISLMSFGDDPWHGYLYKTGKDIKLSWNENTEEDLSYYELKAEYINDEEHVTTYNMGITHVANKEVSRPSVVGLFKFYVRACDTSINCSEWASSDDAINARVHIGGSTVPGNWIVYWMLPAPSNIIIE